jgi:RhoGAP domain/SAM domain (Sterile alpha motif)
MAAAAKLMLKIRFAESEEFGVKLMKLDMALDATSAIELIVSRFNLAASRNYHLYNAQTQKWLEPSDTLSAHHFNAKDVLDIVTASENESSSSSSSSQIVIDLQSAANTWDTAHVIGWLKTLELGPAEEQVLRVFEGQQVTGDQLLQLTDVELKERFELRALGTRKKVSRELSALVERQEQQDSVAIGLEQGQKRHSDGFAAAAASSPTGTRSANLQARAAQVAAMIGGPPPVAGAGAMLAPPGGGRHAAVASNSGNDDVEVRRSRAPSIVQAAAMVAAQHSAAGRAFAPAAQRKLSDLDPSVADGEVEVKDDLMNEIRVAGTLMAEMRAAVESSQSRSWDNVAGSSSGLASAVAGSSVAAVSGRNGRSLGLSTKGLGRVFTSGGGDSRRATSAPGASAPKTMALPLSFGLVARLLEFLSSVGAESIEGIFRVPGNTNTVRIIYAQFSDPRSIDLGGCDPHDVASAFKSYLRELDDPLIPYANYTQLIGCVTAPNQVNVEQLRNYMGLLPAENRSIIRYIVAFLRHLADHAAQNRMDEKNLAIVFGPTLLRSEDPMAGLREAAKQTDIIDSLIRHYAHHFDATTFEQLSAALANIQEEVRSSSPAPNPLSQSTPNASYSPDASLTRQASFGADSSASTNDTSKARRSVFGKKFRFKS